MVINLYLIQNIFPQKNTNTQGSEKGEVYWLDFVKRHKLELPEKREPQLRGCLHRIGQSNDSWEGPTHFEQSQPEQELVLCYPRGVPEETSKQCSSMVCAWVPPPRFLLACTHSLASFTERLWLAHGSQVASAHSNRKASRHRVKKHGGECLTWMLYPCRTVLLHNMQLCSINRYKENFQRIL